MYSISKKRTSIGLRKKVKWTAEQRSSEQQCSTDDSSTPISYCNWITITVVNKIYAYYFPSKEAELMADLRMYECDCVCMLACSLDCVRWYFPLVGDCLLVGCFFFISSIRRRLKRSSLFRLISFSVNKIIFYFC